MLVTKCNVTVVAQFDRQDQFSSVPFVSRSVQMIRSDRRDMTHDRLTLTARTRRVEKKINSAKKGGCL
jgi:hypothetical protein